MNIKYLIVLSLAGCSLNPLVSDVPPDGPPRPDMAPPPPDAGLGKNLLPPGTVVPSVSDNTELINQIRLNDGLSDAALMASGGVVTRSTGKSAGVTVRYWNFGAAPVEGTIAVMGPLYVFGTVDASNVFTPLADHPPLIDTICGDVRYSPIRRVVNVPVTSLYTGERITTMEALADALNLGLVGDPVPDGTWVNMPVVLPGTTIEIGDPATFSPAPTKQVYSHGYLVDVFELGTSQFGRQPLRSGMVPIGQAAGLQTGVATGVPPVLSIAIDAQPVFQYAIPTVAPTTTPNYTPLATDVTVRLATNIAPAAITNDNQLFKRSGTGAITGYLTDNVANYTVNTTMNNLQLQFVEGSL